MSDEKPVKNKKQFELIQKLQYLDRRASGLADQLLQVGAERQLLLAGCVHKWANGKSTLDEGFCLICKVPGTAVRFETEAQQ